MDIKFGIDVTIGGYDRSATSGHVCISCFNTWRACAGFVRCTPLRATWPPRHVQRLGVEMALSGAV